MKLKFKSLNLIYCSESEEAKYPFYYKIDFKLIEDGWQSYTVESEYYKYFSHSDSEWRLSDVNKNFKVSYRLSTILSDNVVSMEFCLKDLSNIS